MNNHRYILEPYKGKMKTKHRCPNCEQDKKFTRYIDTETKEYIYHKVGRCDRSDNCGYHYTPKQYFSDNKCLPDAPQQTYNFKRKTSVLPKESNTSFIPFDTFKTCLGKDLESNNFVKYLISLLGNDATKTLIERYYISTSKLWSGATVFWQIDIDKKIRSGKIMLYDPVTGKRDKSKNSWVHSALKLTDFNLKQCFFGEHLISDKSKAVAIVESDKTAIIMSYYLPQYIWLSSSGKEGLNADKFKALQRRTVILYPDLSNPDAKINCFELWSKKANEFKNIVRITVSDYLEKIASDTEKVQGLDIADYFIKYSSVNPVALIETVAPVEVKNETTNFFIDEVAPITNENWNTEILELETFFNSTTLPVHTVKLDVCSTIIDVYLFVSSHVAIVKANNGNKTFLPYINRLQELKQILTTNLN